MELHRPRVTIGLPVYNGQNYLEQAIRSILDQTYTDFRLIISDNASTDDTPRICEKYAQQDSRIELHRQTQNVGAAPNFNRVFELSNSEYFKWAAHDDALAPDFLKRCVERLDAEPRLTICHALAGRIDQHGEQVGTYDNQLPLAARRPSERFLRALWVDHFTEIWGVMRSSTLRQTSLMGSFVGSDRNLLLEMLLLGEIEYVPQHLFFRRSHPGCYCDSQQTHSDRLRWFDPTKNHHAWASVSIRTWNYFRALSRSPIGTKERLRCVQHLLHWSATRASQKLGRRREIEQEQRRIRAKLDPISSNS